MTNELKLFLEAQARYFERLADVNNAHASYIKSLLANSEQTKTPPSDINDLIG